jgi:DNA invertase Pin-like site-specific DNA recombinase
METVSMENGIMSKAKLARNQARRVYSYIRFSTPEQALGGSERRQLKNAEAWAKQHGHELDTTLRLIDRGKSGRSGEHRRKGALGEFLKQVQDGSVPSGSILLVENIDRLSREDIVQAFETVTQLVTRGISIVTLQPSAEYTRESISGGLVWQLIGQMQRAFEESQRKSDLISASREAARQKARDKKRILTKQVPAWLIANEARDGFKVADGAKATISRIFKLKLQGLGVRTIAATLNTEARWTPPKSPKRKSSGWRHSYIKKILANRAVLGEYQPYRNKGGANGERAPIGDPIDAYYPSVVDSDLFYAVQKQLAENRGKGGRNGKSSNLLKHLAVCAYCGGAMHFTDKGAPPKGGKYLYCEAGKRKAGCEPRSIRYDECEAAILENCEHLEPGRILPNQDEHAKRCESLRESVQNSQAEKQGIERELDNLADQIGKTDEPDMRDRYESKAKARLARLRELTQQIEDKGAELRIAESAQKSFVAWKQGLKEMKAVLARGGPEVRMRLHAHLRELIDRIEVFTHGHKQMFDADQEFIAKHIVLYFNEPMRRLKKRDRDAFERALDHQPVIREADGERMAEIYEVQLSRADRKWKPTKEFRGFQEWLTKKRMSKAGRFLRVHFKSGEAIDIIPGDSIASGERLVAQGKSGKRTWAYVDPDFEDMLKLYERET